MGRRPVLESKLRKLIRDPMRFDDGSVSFIEYGHGGDAGIPDTLVHWEDRLVPLELKRGPSVLKALRPAQRLWHRTTLTNGAQTFGASIEASKGWSGGFVIWLFELHCVDRKLSEQSLCGMSHDTFCYDELATYFAKHIRRT